MLSSPKIPPAPRWDLESIFPGGSGSPQYKAFCEKVRQSLADAAEKLDKLPKSLTAQSSAEWQSFILLLQDVLENIKLIKSFAGMLGAQDVNDPGAPAAESVGDELMSEWNKLKTGFEAMAMRQPDDVWEKLVTGDQLKPVRFFLDDMRHEAKSKMPVELESLALDLGVSGYQAWNRIYDKLAGDLRADFPVDGQTKRLSMGPERPQARVRETDRVVVVGRRPGRDDPEFARRVPSLALQGPQVGFGSVRTAYAVADVARGTRRDVDRGRSREPAPAAVS
jgi:oligoendopeptidase F